MNIFLKFSWYIPKNRIAGNSMFTFGGADKLFSMLSAPFIFPSVGYNGSNFFITSAMLIFFTIFIGAQLIYNVVEY